MKSRRTPKLVFLLILFALGIFLYCGEGLLEISSDDGHEKVDAAVVLGGSPREDAVRVKEGVGLVGSGRARYLILPIRHKGLDWEWFERNYDIQESLLESQVVIGEGDAESDGMQNNRGGTFAEAAKTVRIMARNGFNSAIIISSGYHMRRARMAFESVKEKRHVKLLFHPVNGCPEEGKAWWSKGERLIPVLIEYCKLVAAFFLYQKT